jgi:CelD/BcsL family acetyltransferase involved in cellulose biosynthesis
MMADCRWITLEELQQRRDEWRALASASEFPIAFSDPAWVLAWWESYGEGYEPWTLALDSSRLARTLFFAGGTWNGLVSLICAPGCEAEFSASLIEALSERRRAWDVWRIQRLPTQSVLARTLLDGGSGLRAAAHDLRLQPYLELPAEVEQFEASFGSKQRNTQRRKWRKLTELGAVPRLVGDPEQVEVTLRALLELRRERAIAMDQRHSHMDARYAGFLLAAVRGLLPDGARLWTLELGGEMLASRLNLIVGTREHSYLLGLSDEHQNLSPGNSLELHAIHEAIRQGRTELELGPGRDVYKYRLGGRDREITRLVASSGSPRGRAVTAPRATDLRLRNSALAAAVRRRKGNTPERADAGGPSPNEQQPQPSIAKAEHPPLAGERP